MNINLFEPKRPDLVDTHLSFFTYLKDEKANPVERFGEWFFNFKQEDYQLRNDGLESHYIKDGEKHKWGHEVTKIEPAKKESILWNFVRGGLLLTGIIPAIALVAKLVHREPFKDLHENKLEDKFRYHPTIFTVPNIPANGLKQEVYDTLCHDDRVMYQQKFFDLIGTRRFADIEPDTYATLIRQPAPWFMPDQKVYFKRVDDIYVVTEDIELDEDINSKNIIKTNKLGLDILDKFGKIVEPKPKRNDLYNSPLWRGIHAQFEISHLPEDQGFFYDPHYGKYYYYLPVDGKKTSFPLDKTFIENSADITSVTSGIEQLIKDKIDLLASGKK